MPYIKRQRRPQFEPEVNMLANVMANDVAGDLNYIIFAAARRIFARENGSYEKIRNVRAELRESHDEIGRRILVEHEKRKILENGDVT